MSTVRFAIVALLVLTGTALKSYQAGRSSGISLMKVHVDSITNSFDRLHEAFISVENTCKKASQQRDDLLQRVAILDGQWREATQGWSRAIQEMEQWKELYNANVKTEGLIIDGLNGRILKREDLGIE